MVTTAKPTPLLSLRCWKCNALLVKHALQKGIIEAKCHSCNALTTLAQ